MGSLNSAGIFLLRAYLLSVSSLPVFKTQLFFADVTQGVFRKLQIINGIPIAFFNIAAGLFQK